MRDRVEIITGMPEMYGVIGHGIRAAPLQRFPYVIYYRVQGELIVVLAVTHGRQRQQGWEVRV